MIDVRVAYFALWAVGLVVVFSVNLRRELRSLALHDDERSRRDAMVAAALFVCAWASAGLVGVGLLGGELRTNAVGLLTGLSTGGFLAVGIILVTTPRRRDPADHG